MTKPARLAAIAIILLGGVFLAGKAAAASSNQGITVSPAFQQVSIPLGAQSQPVSFKLTNNTASSQTLRLSVDDFNTLSESGGLFFEGINPTQLQKKYGLAKWVSLPETKLMLAAGQSQTLRAEILNLTDLAPGGHYGALMVALAGASGAGQNSVSLHSIASSLMFVTKLGGDTHILKLANVYVTRSLFQLPNKITLRFYNAGNTHLVPRGTVSITTGQGRLVSKGIINENSDIILPQTYRQLTVPLQKVSAGNSVGQYKLAVDFRFDGEKQFRAYQTGLFVLPPYLLIVFAAVIVLILAAILGYIRFKRPKS